MRARFLLTQNSRRALLQDILPGLKIAGRCRFNGRFQNFRGKLRGYKIHLGAGNILMEPNDQYLCIAPSAGNDFARRIELPFEGDKLLSIILSKAMLLADDDKIKDPPIVSQIMRR